jgi:hypothetical protein
VVAADGRGCPDLILAPGRPDGPVGAARVDRKPTMTLMYCDGRNLVEVKAVTRD